MMDDLLGNNDHQQQPFQLVPPPPPPPPAAGAAVVMVEDDDDESVEDDPAYPFLHNLPDRIISPDDPRRNKLSFDEWRFLCRIQNHFHDHAVTSEAAAGRRRGRSHDENENDNHNDNIDDDDDETTRDSEDTDFVMPSDYVLCQVAIHCHNAGVVAGETEAMRKAYGIQKFRERYGIRDTIEEGRRALQDLVVELFPLLFLHHGFSPEEGTYQLVVDMDKFDTTVLNNERRYNQFMIGEYYLLQAMNCDLATIRMGSQGIFDCIDVGWTMKADFKILKDLFQQLISFYPASPTVKHRNVGVVFNLLFSTAKKVLPAKIRNKFDFAHSAQDGGALRNVFMVPTVQRANARVVASLQEALQKRYDNETNMCLF